MPCSPVMVPPRRMASSKISVNASCTRCISSALRSSVRKVGCRLPSPMWPKVPIFNLCFFATASTKRIMWASSLRGTVASSRMVVGAKRARALNALRRAVASCAASAASLATRTSMAPLALASSSILAASSATAAGWPSVSINSSASQSSGRPTFEKSSTQWMVVRSRNSSVHGMICAAMMSLTVCAAASIASKVATIVFFAAGLGMSLSSTLVMTPSVPSLPIITSFSEKPATSFTHLFPSHITSPSGSTTSRPIT